MCVCACARGCVCGRGGVCVCVCVWGDLSQSQTFRWQTETLSLFDHCLGSPQHFTHLFALLSHFCSIRILPSFIVSSAICAIALEKAQQYNFIFVISFNLLFIHLTEIKICLRAQNEQQQRYNGDKRNNRNNNSKNNN